MPPAPLPRGCRPAPSAAPAGARGEADAAVAEGRRVLPTRLCPLLERRQQPRGRLWPRLAASQALCFLLWFLWPASNPNTAGNMLAAALAELFFHCAPCCCLCCHLQKPGLLFVKPLREEAFTPTAPGRPGEG